MKKVKSIVELAQYMGIIKDYRKGFITNFFLDQFKHTIWIENEQLFIEEIGESVILLRENAGFYSLFYVSTGTESLESSLIAFLSRHQQNVIVTDLVGNENNLAPEQIFLHQGFRHYASLTRMTRINNSPQQEYALNPNVEVGSVYDVNAIFELLHQHFDPIAEQLPLLQELQKYAENNGLIIYRDGTNIAGFIIYELSGKTSYLRYWFVHPQYRGQKIGSSLFYHLLHLSGDARRLILWVLDSNDNAIKMYLHFGAVFEKMFNYVLIKKVL